MLPTYRIIYNNVLVATLYYHISILETPSSTLDPPTTTDSDPGNQYLSF